MLNVPTPFRDLNYLNGPYELSNEKVSAFCKMRLPMNHLKTERAMKEAVRRADYL
jgi:hypothetical protein